MNKIILVLIFNILSVLFSLSAEESSNDLILISGGTFELEAESNDFLNFPDHKIPLHSVYVSDFYLAKNLLTVKEWKDYLKETGKPLPKPSNWGFQDNHPITEVDFFDALAYCNWRSVKEGLTPAYKINKKEVRVYWSANGYRLPTEEEWEYAISSQGKMFKMPPPGEWNRKGMLIGSFPPNERGLYDMVGNGSQMIWSDAAMNGGFSVWNPRGSNSGERYNITRGLDYSDRSEVGLRLSRSAPFSLKDISALLSIALSRTIDLSIYTDTNSLKYFIILVLLSYFLTGFYLRKSILKQTKEYMAEKKEEDNTIKPVRSEIPIPREIKSNLIIPDRNSQSTIRKLFPLKSLGNWILLGFVFLLTMYMNQIFMLVLDIVSFYALPCLFLLFFFVNGIFYRYLAKPFNQIIFSNLRKKIQNLPECRVLILRVFGDPGSTSFLFDWFAEKWRLFGSSITIADPILVQQEFRINNLLRPESHLFITYFISQIIAIIGFFIYPFFYVEPGRIDFMFVTTLALYILVPSFYWQITMLVRFSSSRKLIQKMERPEFWGKRNSRLEFPMQTLFCYDSSWKKAVEVAAKNVDLVLMDVRDYSLERAGSSWELGFLAHFFPLSRVLFLVDSEEKKTMIEGIFKKEISFIAPGSPNDTNVTMNFSIPDQGFRGMRASTDVVEALWELK